MGRICFSLGLVVIGIALGYAAQRLVDFGILPATAGGLGRIRRKLQRIALLLLNPIAVIGATWVANIRSVQLIALPILCVAALLLGGLCAHLLARLFRLSRQQTGAYLVCGSFTNIGSLGALFCYIFLGEQGFALVPIYKLFEEVYYYTVGFPVAKSYSAQIAAQERLGSRIRSICTDPFVASVVASICLGLILNLAGLQRPAFYQPLNAILIPTITFLLLLSIGMGMRFASIRRYLGEALAIAGVKFLVIPAFIVAAGSLAGLGAIDDGLPLKVVLILASMPTAFTAMVPPSIYDLDVDLANACWLVTNGLLLLVLPVLVILAGWL